MNIMITSVGRRVKLIEYFKEEFHKIGGKVIAYDCDPTAPALYHADIFEIGPTINDPNYTSHIIHLCRKWKVKGILSLIDPELSMLTRMKDELEKVGTTAIVSDEQVIQTSFSKAETYNFLKEKGLPHVPTYTSFEEVFRDLVEKRIHFPLIVKPCKGSASIGVQKIHSFHELKGISFQKEDRIVQPFIEGEEYGIDIYTDIHSKELVRIFTKKKIKMRAGETDKSVSIWDPALTKLMEKLVLELKPIGPMDVDVFKTEKGYCISEINPRFGGGYPHAHELGQNFVRCILNNLLGKTNKPSIGTFQPGVIMAKYEKICLIEEQTKINEAYSI